MKMLVGCVISIIFLYHFKKRNPFINTMPNTHNFATLVFPAKSRRPNEHLILSIYKYVNIKIESNYSISYLKQ